MKVVAETSPDGAAPVLVDGDRDLWAERTEVYRRAARAALGACFLGAYKKVAALLGPEHFPLDLKPYFKAIAKVAQQGDRIDILAVLAANPSLDVVMLAELASEVPTSANAET